MDIMELEQVVQNVDRRLSRIEQILPTLATKDDLKAYATKDDLKALATKDDLKAYATKEDLRAYATRDDLKAEGEVTRQHFNAVAERLESQIQLIAEGQVGLQERFDGFRDEVRTRFANHESRITRIEASRLRPVPPKKRK